MGGINPVGPPDPYFSSVVLLLHMDGADGGTTFIDSSSANRVASNIGVVTKPDVKRFGSASALISTGPGDPRLSYTNSVDFDVGNGDFTIECWIYVPTGHPTSNSVIMTKAVGTGTYPYMLNIDASGKLRFAGFNTSDVLIYNLQGTTVLAHDTMYFVQGRRSGDTLALAVNGVQEASVNVTAGASLRYNASAPLSVGNYDAGGSYPVYGYIDDFRFTKGVARAFAVPTRPFPNS